MKELQTKLDYLLKMDVDEETIDMVNEEIDRLRKAISEYAINELKQMINGN
jgi:hypothetical protein